MSGVETADHPSARPTSRKVRAMTPPRRGKHGLQRGFDLEDAVSENARSAVHWRGAHQLTETIAAFAPCSSPEKSARGASAISMPTASTRPRPSPGARPRPGALPCAGAQDRAYVIPWCEGHGAPVVAYSLVGPGSFPASGARWRRARGNRGGPWRRVALAFLVPPPAPLYGLDDAP
jgi:hypothetical protein